MSRDSYIQHAHRHLPNGTDPLAMSGVPSVATFYTSVDHGDSPISAGAGLTTIVWEHAALPSDGLITGPTIADANAEFQSSCITQEWLYLGWEPGAYPRAGVLGTNSRIVTGDRVGLDNGGDDDLTTITQDTYAWTLDHRPNAHVAGDLMHAYAVNGDGSAHDISQAFLVIYAWPAAGYLGAIPGFPL